MRNTSRSWLLLSIVAPAIGLAAPSAMAQSITAQSVQVHFEGVESAYNIEEEQTWSYNWAGQPAALAAFDTYFNATTAGGPNASQFNTGKHNAFKDPNRCNFWGGDPLAVVVSTFGARSVTATPKAPSQYLAKTGWTMTSHSLGDPIDITVSEIFIASQSVVKNTNPKRNAPWTQKASFSMEDGLGNSRLTALTIDLLYDDDPSDAIPAVVLETLSLGADFNQILESGQDWLYQENAGTFGNPLAIPLLVDGYVDDILGGIVGGDNFAGNDLVGGTRALIPDLMYTVSDPGEYTLKFSGVIKGNGFVGDQGFTVATSLVIIGGCT